jgi:asparagine N-glycosylation enzyme membrane subunit Stt3
MLRNPFEDPDQRQRLLRYGFIAAILAAPFLGLLYGLWVGALVMAIALLVTAFLVFDLLTQAPPERRERMRRLGLVNVLLAIACLIAAIASY